jgi:hypothetical protein
MIMSSVSEYEITLQRTRGKCMIPAREIVTVGSLNSVHTISIVIPIQ